MLLGTQGLESRLASFSEEKKKKKKFWTWPKRSAAVALASLALVGAASMGGKKGIGKAKGGSIPSGGKIPSGKSPSGGGGNPIKDSPSGGKNTTEVIVKEPPVSPLDPTKKALESTEATLKKLGNPNEVWEF
jgi:hypothetical protein